MQLNRIIYYSLAALYVSSDIFAYHQEHLNCITDSSITVQMFLMMNENNPRNIQSSQGIINYPTQLHLVGHFRILEHQKVTLQKPQAETYGQEHFVMTQQPQWAGASSLVSCLDHTQTHDSRQESSGRVISPSQRRLPDNKQRSQETDIHALGGFRTHISSKRAAADPGLKLRGHWDGKEIIRTNHVR